MADNTVLNGGTGGDTIATDDITGVKYQRVKVNYGADGVAIDVSTSNPLPVTPGANSGVDIGDVTVNNGVGAGAVPIQDGGNSITVDGPLTNTELRASAISVDASGTAVPVTDGGGSITVDGAFYLATQPISAAALPLPAGAATSAKQPALGTAGTASADVLTVQGKASMTPLVVDGSAVTQPVSGTFYPGTQPVSGPLTDTQLRASVVPIGDGGGSLTVDGVFYQATQPVSIAAAVPVTDNAGSLTVDGTFWQATQPVSGTFYQATQPVSLASVPSHAVTNAGTFAVQGTFWQATQPVSLASVPSHAVTNAGTFAVQAVAAGVAAHGAAISGNPVRNAGRALIADYTAVTTGQTADLITDTLGKQIVLIGALPGNSLSGTANYTTTTGADAIAAQAAGIKIAVMGIMVTNAHATVGTKVSIRDGTTTKLTGYAAALGGGFALAATTPIFYTTAATAVTAICATTGADVDVSVWGYKCV